MNPRTSTRRAPSPPSAATSAWEPDQAGALFMISRLPGIVAHALEEQQRQPPMRFIDPSGHEYDGPDERRLPETRR